MPISDQVLDRGRARLGPSRLTWLVTGAAGFIGSNLVEALLRLDQTVVALDNFSTGRRENLEDVRRVVSETAWRRFTFRQGDLRDLEACRDCCAGVDLVLHEAALGSVPRSVADPIASHTSNVDGHLNLLVAARDCGVRRLVYASSSSVYGDDASLPKVESQVGRPLSPYAATKRVNEMYADVFARAYGLQYVGLRYFNVFGPRQDPEGAYAAVIPRWIAAMLRGERCPIYGDGETSRDFCFVDNVIQANLLAALSDDAASVNEVYNIAVGGRMTLNDLHRVIRRELQSAYPDRITGDGLGPEYLPFRAGDVRHSQADIGKARRLLGFVPTHDVAEGLRLSLAWYLSNALPGPAPSQS